MAKRILITGGTGFLGVHVARKFLKERYEVILLDMADLDAADLIDKVRVIKADIRDKKALDGTMKGIDYVVHAAAALPIQVTKDAIYSVNINGTKNVLAEALKQKVKRLVYISSTAVYGVPKYLPETEETPIVPVGYYGISKVEGEKLCLQYQKKGLQLNIIRPKTFLGTERLGVFELWFEAIYTGHSVFLLGNGNNLYQLLAVSDLVDLIEKTLTTKINGEIFNAGAKAYGSWKSDLGYVINHAKSKSKFITLPAKPSQLILQVLEKLNLSPLSEWHYKTMPVDSYVSIEKAEKLLKWKPKKSNKDLFLESYLWYKKNRNDVINRVGNTHRVGWNFKLLNLVSKL